jgi:hypothetical protein
MTLSRFNGPVYGAKSVLWSIGPMTGSSGGSSALVARILVPAYERWLITELNVSASTNSSLYLTQLKAKGGTTSADFPSGNAGTVASVSAGASTGGFNLITTATPTAGEYEGYLVTENSTLRIVSSGVNPPTNYTINVRGFIRYIDSTRAV